MDTLIQVKSDVLSQDIQAIIQYSLLLFTAIMALFNRRR